MGELEYFYRFESTARSAGVDEFDNSLGTHYDVALRRYVVIKHTPKGTWIAMGAFAGKRFVLRDARKKFAHPNIQDALASFEHRKARQIAIYNARVERARRDIRRAQQKVETFMRKGY